MDMHASIQYYRTFGNAMGKLPKSPLFSGIIIQVTGRGMGLIRSMTSNSVILTTENS